jgi:hypothetical protein
VNDASSSEIPNESTRHDRLMVSNAHRLASARLRSGKATIPKTSAPRR